MPVIESLICTETNGTISFGNYTLDKKSKLSDFEHEGDLYKVKTFGEITKLERNGLFVYESVPGTAVNHFKVTDGEISFEVEGAKDSQITLQMEDATQYEIYLDDVSVGDIKTNGSGKLIVSVELNEGSSRKVRIVKK